MLTVSAKVKLRLVGQELSLGSSHRNCQRWCQDDSGLIHLQNLLMVRLDDERDSLTRRTSKGHFCNWA